MITFTEAAKAKLIRACKDEGTLGEQTIRIQVRGGGCAGFKYDMYFDELPPVEGDIVENVVRNEVVSIDCRCDPISLMYLEGVIVDHEVQTMREGFVFKNPNVTATCGCGKSFSA